MLPYELAVYILSHVDVLTVIHMSQVSRRWKIICEDPSLWKQLFVLKGWRYDQQAITNYLNESTNKGKTKISTIPTSSSSSRSPVAITNDTRYDPAALPTMPGAPSSRLGTLRRPGDIFLRLRQRRPSPTSSSPTSIQSFESMLVNEPTASQSTDPAPTDLPPSSPTTTSDITKRGSKLLLFDTNRRQHHRPILVDSKLPVTIPSLSTVPSTIRKSHPTPSCTRISVSSTLKPTLNNHPHDDVTQHRVIERRPFKNRPISRQHVHYDETALYHYQEENDRRFINWRRLYRNRNLIEKRWRDGQYWMHNMVDSSSEHHTDWIYCLQFNHRILISGSRDRTIKIWALHTGACLHTLYGHKASVLCLQFDDKYIISGSSDATMVMWDVTSAKRIRKLMGHDESVLNLRFAGNRLVSSSKDRTIRVWDLGTGSTTQVLRGHRAAVNAVQFKDDMVVSASGDRTIRLWNAATGVSLRTFDSHSRGIACVEFDGQCIVSGSSDQSIKVWNQATGECLTTMAGHTDLVRTLQMDRHSNRIVSGSYDGSIKIWNMDKGVLIKSLNDKVEGRILNLQFDYAKIICCTNMSKIVIYDFTYGLDTQFLDTSLPPASIV
ncbi:WD40-repeat-containing domain protein [Chlamydoabsidia padenii]|nr:WD40-repeat-containing domain protein [Chlamydoabsidia padenii]